MPITLGRLPFVVDLVEATATTVDGVWLVRQMGERLIRRRRRGWGGKYFEKMFKE